MKRINTQAIILNRFNYGEADRIINVLTPNQGKLTLIARGSRKEKSKLAGGIELFSISQLSYIKGKGEIGTLVSSRLIDHYSSIIKDIKRVELGYELTKQLNKFTEDQTDEEFYILLNNLYVSLNKNELDINLIRLWFNAQMMKIDGQTPNLYTDNINVKLNENFTYNYDYNSMSFKESKQGTFNSNHIKLLRLIFSNLTPIDINNVEQHSSFLIDIEPLINNMIKLYVLTK